MFYETYAGFGLNLARAAIDELKTEVEAFDNAVAIRTTYGRPLGLSESFERALQLRQLQYKCDYLRRAHAAWLCLKNADDPDGDWDDFDTEDEDPEPEDIPGHSINYTDRQLQKKYWHSRAFGFPKNYTPPMPKNLVRY